MDTNKIDHIATDLLIIGGGINGCGIARDAAGRGLSVTLCESGDIASATSSWSSKLIHGGLRYLETYQFKLVRQSLHERAILMNMAPFLIKPLEFILPHEPHLRSPLLLRLGLFLYDHLKRCPSIPKSKKINLTTHTLNNPLKSHLSSGFSYYDCQTNDARLTLLNAIDAKQHGANILTYTHCELLEKYDTDWRATVTSKDGTQQFITAKAVINATGPWADQFNQKIAGLNMASALKLVQGSHIIVPQLYQGQHAYILQHQDHRIVFAIPYLNRFTLIGTTDTEFKGNPNNAHITNDETHYLCNIINHYFKKNITPQSIVSSYSGVRALYNDDSDNPSKTSRDYHLSLETTQPAFLCVYGGKLTTFRSLAEDTLDKLKPYFPNMGKPWTARSALPGGDLNGLSVKDYTAQLQAEYAWLGDQQLERYIGAYGSYTQRLLGNACNYSDLGKRIGADLYEAEIEYWKQHELAKTSEDMLQRRSQFRRILSSDEINRVKAYT
jgi:glycerol-3-phosphate dehydrogenase